MNQKARTKPATGPTPTNQNTTGQIKPKTQRPPRRAPTNPRAANYPDELHDFLDSVETPEQLKKEWGELQQAKATAEAAGDRLGANAAKDALSGLKMKAPSMGLSAKDLPGTDSTFTDILGTFLGGGRGSVRRRTAQPAQGQPKTAEGSTGAFSLGEGGKQDCGVKPYKDLNCPKGQQKHHIVPDYTLRYGTRTDAGARIPGMPSLNDGPSICLSGGSKTQGSDHNKAHEGTDPRIAKEGDRTDNGKLGTAPIGDIIDISVEEVSKVKPHCAEEIKRETEKAFKDVDRNKYGRTTQQPPKPDSEAHGPLARGDKHTSNTPKPRGRTR